MANINIAVILIALIISSCNDIKKGIWIPGNNKLYENVYDLEEDSILISFAHYMGFITTIDSIYLQEGYIEQELDLGDISSDKLIEKFKTKPIKEIIFVGDSISTDKFKENYSLVLKKSPLNKNETSYNVFTTNGLYIGVLRIRNNGSYQLILHEVSSFIN